MITQIVCQAIMGPASRSLRDHGPPLRRGRRRQRLGGLLVLVIITVATPSALAHGDEGVMRVQAVRSVGLLRVYIETGVLHTDDDLATEAEVTADLTGPDGETVGPVPVPRISGARYGTEVALPGPGRWTVTFTSTNPRASGTASVTVPAPSATTSTTAPPSTTTTVEPAGDDRGVGGGPVAAIVVGLIAAAGLAVVMARRRRA